MAKDLLYTTKNTIENFNFNEAVSLVFDDMVSRSVPFYQEFQELIVKYVQQYVPSPSAIYDLGCGTGTTLLLLHDKLKERPVQLVGVDDSAAMLQKAEEKAAALGAAGRIRWIEDDLGNIDLYENAGCFLLNLTLQFIRPIKRRELIASFYERLQPGGLLVLFEKLLEDDRTTTRQYIKMYYDFKRDNQYSDLEISRKREELENVLIPYTESEYKHLLADVGFEAVTTIGKYLNFGVFIARK